MQYDPSDVEARIDDIVSCGGEVYWTSLTQETGIAVISVEIPEDRPFFSDLLSTNSYQFLVYGN